LGEIDQAQANFQKARESALKAGASSPEAKSYLKRLKEAEKFAKAKGWAFDPKTGYTDRNLEVGDPGWRDTVSVASRPEPKEQIPDSERGGGTASFQMPDGTMQQVTGDRSVVDQFAEIRAGDDPGASSVSADSPDGSGADSSQYRPETLDDYMTMNPGASKPGYGNKPLTETQNPNPFDLEKNPINPAKYGGGQQTIASIDTPEPSAPADGGFKAPKANSEKVPSGKDLKYKSNLRRAAEVAGATVELGKGYFKAAKKLNKKARKEYSKIPEKRRRRSYNPIGF